MKIHLTVGNDVDSPQVKQWLSAIENKVNTDSEVIHLLDKTNLSGFTVSVTLVPDPPEPAQQPKPPPKEQPAHEQPIRNRTTTTGPSRR
jgi:hypothetical protein